MPVAEPEEHGVGGSLTVAAPHDGGTVPFLRSAAESSWEYDHVKSDADKGSPSSRPYCSDMVPVSGVYCC